MANTHYPHRRFFAPSARSGSAVRLLVRPVLGSLLIPAVLSACAGQPDYPIYQPYQAYPGYPGATPLPAPVPRPRTPGVPSDIATPNGVIISPPGGISPGTTPLETSPPPLVPSTPPASSTDEAPGQTPGTPGAATAPDAGRFDALKSSLEKEGQTAPATDPLNQPASSGTNATGAAQATATGTGTTGTAAAAGLCTKVRTRSGFHDHYGGLNSAGDVLPTCTTP